MRLPGFIDSHMHVLGLGYVTFNLDLTKATCIEDIQTIIQTSKQKTMIIGRGWNQEELLEKRMPTKNDLNAACSDLPIVLVRVCGHVIVVNDAMLKLAGITSDSSQIPGGEFSFETGIFSEKALNLIYDNMPKPTKNDLRKYFIKADEILLSKGITSVASDDFSTLAVDYELIIETVKELYEEQLLHVQITEQVNLPYNLLEEFIAKGYVNKRFGLFQIGPLKILADGSLGGKTAFLNEPYELESNNRGIQTYTDDELLDLVYLADSNNMDVVIHAIGDGAVDQVLNAFIESKKMTERNHHKHAIIHAQLATNTQIENMVEHQIGAIVQPIFLNTDIPIIFSRIGSRAKESYLFKTMYDQGIKVGFSTDCPIEPVNPFYNIYTAISRKSLKFQALDAFLPAEGFDIKSALNCYINHNYNYLYDNYNTERDYIVIDEDIYTCNVEDIPNIQVLETYINNELVYKK